MSEMSVWGRARELELTEKSKYCVHVRYVKLTWCFFFVGFKLQAIAGVLPTLWNNASSNAHLDSYSQISARIDPNYLNDQRRCCYKLDDQASFCRNSQADHWGARRRDRVRLTRLDYFPELKKAAPKFLTPLTRPQIPLLSNWVAHHHHFPRFRPWGLSAVAYLQLSITIPD